MAATNGPSRGGDTAGKTVGRRVLSRPPQRTHSLQRPQQSQSRLGSQGPISLEFDLNFKHFCDQSLPRLL